MRIRKGTEYFLNKLLDKKAVYEVIWFKKCTQNPSPREPFQYIFNIYIF